MVTNASSFRDEEDWNMPLIFSSTYFWAITPCARILSPTFRFSRLARFCPIMVESVSFAAKPSPLVSVSGFSFSIWSGRTPLMKTDCVPIMLGAMISGLTASTPGNDATVLTADRGDYAGEWGASDGTVDC